MTEINLLQKKIGLNVLIWVMIIFTLFLLNQCSRNIELKKEVTKIRKEMKTDYEERIKKRELIIQGLEKDNQVKKLQIERMIEKIDSLDKVKEKIKIKYVDRIQEIKVMDSEKIKNYWDGQFK